MFAQLRQQGMTLLELLVVIALLSVVGFMALSQVGDDLSQVRYEDTRNRLDMIREAITGDPSRTVNGQPEIRGFVADMGRLPLNLKELIEPPEDCDADGNLTDQQDRDLNGLPDECEYTIYDGHCLDDSYTNEPSCTGAGSLWYPDAGGIWAGWNGPYLVATSEDGGSKIFRDGWGNDDGSNNFGWSVTPVDHPSIDSNGDGNYTNDVDELWIASYGADGQAGDSGIGLYDADYPDTTGDQIIPGDYLTRMEALSIDFGRPHPYCTDRAYELESTCRGASETWIPAPWCSDPQWTDQGTCEGSGETWMIKEPSCSTTPSVFCVSSDVSGTWVDPWCSAIAGPDPQAICEAADGDWSVSGVLCDFGVNEFQRSSPCRFAGGDWAWPYETLCLRLFTATNGSMPDVGSAPHSSNQVAVLLDGERRSGAFTFPTNTAAAQGVRALGVYWYDSASTSCTEAAFPLGQDPRAYSIVPRSAGQGVSWPLN